MHQNKGLHKRSIRITHAYPGDLIVRHYTDLFNNSLILSIQYQECIFDRMYFRIQLLTQASAVVDMVYSDQLKIDIIRIDDT